MVKRVSARVGRGLTLALALAAENNGKINDETWKKALQAHPEFSPHYEAGKGKFLDKAIKRIAAEKNTKYLCWLLERRHPDLFARHDTDVASGAGTTVHVSQSVAVGIPADVLERARELAREDQSKGPSRTGPSPNSKGGPNG